MSAWINAFTTDPMPAIIVLASLVVVGLSGVWYADHWREKAETLEGRLEASQRKNAELRAEIQRRDVNLRLLPPYEQRAVVGIEEFREVSAASRMLRQIDEDIAQRRAGERNGTR